MNVQDFTNLLQFPNSTITVEQTKQLADVIDNYPFFQAARAVQLKSLKDGNSFKYNDALKVTAAYTADREVLFDYITTAEFNQNSVADTISGKNTLEDTPIDAIEIETTGNETPIDAHKPLSIAAAEAILDPNLFEAKNPDELQLGKPLEFTNKEKYSFAEWLQLTTINEVEDTKKVKVKTEEELEIKAKTTPKKSDKKKKFDLIDKFITDNPKIKPSKENPNASPAVNLESSINIDKEELMTETLARVYLEQKKYKSAIQAYRILSLKYPEKSGFFADRIRAVKNLQQDNK